MIIQSSKATYEASKAEAKNIIKNAYAHAVQSEYVQVNAANVENSHWWNSTDCNNFS